MDTQNEIKRTLKQETSIEVIRGLLAQQAHRSRFSVAETVCQHFGFLDARQRTQTAGCVKALRELGRAGHFVLPAALDRGRAGARSPGVWANRRRLRATFRSKQAMSGDSR